MNVLGIMMVRNGAGTLKNCLDRMAGYCDQILALNDRSSDQTQEILEGHPAVRNIFSASSDSTEDWHYSESLMLELLYRMADFVRPDWINIVDADEFLDESINFRGVLESLPQEVVAIKALKRSLWNDPEFPLLVPLMGRAESIQGDTWRYFPNLQPRKKRLHNCRLPDGIENRGQVAVLKEVVFHHRGWDTLRERIEKVDLYSKIDPDYALNEGVPYDRALLFGYARNEISELIAEYQRRYRTHVTSASAG